MHIWRPVASVLICAPAALLPDMYSTWASHAHALTRTRMCARVRARTLTHIHTRTHTHTYTHAPPHTRTHTHKYTAPGCRGAGAVSKVYAELHLRTVCEVCARRPTHLRCAGETVRAHR